MYRRWPNSYHQRRYIRWSALALHAESTFLTVYTDASRSPGPVRHSYRRGSPGRMPLCGRCAHINSELGQTAFENTSQPALNERPSDWRGRSHVLNRRRASLLRAGRVRRTDILPIRLRHTRLRQLVQMCAVQQ